MIVVIGDAILDEHTYLKTIRASRKGEQKVPITSYDKRIRTFGGCGVPAQWLRHLGHDVTIITGYAEDQAGIDIRNLLYTDAEIINVGSIQTTVKTRIYVDNVLLFRQDMEQRVDLSVDSVMKKLLKLNDVTRITAILFSDYGYGMVTRELVQRVVKWNTDERMGYAQIVVDPRSTDFSDYSGVDVITPNQEEFDNACGWHESDELEIIRSMNTANFVLLTRGSNGVRVYRRDPCLLMKDIRGEKSDAVDTTGAGDAFVAHVVSEMVRGATVVGAAEVANRMAGKAVESFSGVRFRNITQ